MDIKDVDKNFAEKKVEAAEYDEYLPTALGLEGFPWHKENKNPYCRLPERILPKMTEEIRSLAVCTAGGVIRFCTNSPSLRLTVDYRPFWSMSHMPLTGQAGFDLFVHENGQDRFLQNFAPDSNELKKNVTAFTFSCSLPKGMHEYRIFMPLYAGVQTLSIGLQKGSCVEKAPRHAVEKPILFYGSSITQGGCASRPYNCHAAMLTSLVDAEQINLGFSGNAKGEPEMAEAIRELDLSCFVMDYDYNAPTLEYLQKTHEPFFRIIREKHPDLPVIFISRPFANPDAHADEPERRNTIMQTYIHAVEQGDRNVYFVDGMRFFTETPIEMPTVDRCHPTDLGFYFMTKAIAPVLRRALHL